MTDQRFMLFERLVDSLLTTPGDTPTELRSALAHDFARYSSSALPVGKDLSPELEMYVKKVARHAYRVTAQDIEELISEGYSEDAIFEITLSVALGSGMRCLEHGLMATEEASYALKGD